ncbi:hypothetical protein [Asticcacaulis taihuensis]|uniref:hypothetical protein n=1 Tax=Asticcacaulis taihuensis TaxID=260084 RepID=UPI0026F04A29|nr:hypothetical protein [Asticcacaulis taihuensis]
MFKNNFTSGELNPNLWGRSDLAQFGNGCAVLQNFVPLVEGPARRRAGFWFNGLPKAAGTACILIPYVRALDDAYVIEMGDGYSRFWQVNGSPIMDPANPTQPLELASGYTAGQLSGLRWKQIGDVIVFFHRTGLHPRRLQKVSETSWNWDYFNFEDGPWRGENSDASVTIQATDWRKGQVVTLSASAAIFAAGMVGTFFRLRSGNGLPGLRTWAADEDPKGYALRYSNDGVYYTADAVSTEKTGNTPPTHDIGTASDGLVNWTFLHDNSGMVQIIGYTSPTVVTAVISRNLPILGTYNATDKEWQLAGNPASIGQAFPATFAWSEAVYSDYRGWPTAWPELREERFLVAGGAAAPDKYCASQTAGYSANSAVFTPGRGTGTVLDDDAIQGFVGDDSFKAQWLVSGPMLVCGTHGGEAVLVGETGEAPLTPSTTKPRALTRYGSADGVRPIKAQDSILFVTRGNKSLRDLSVSVYDYPGSGSDLSFIAKHIANRKFVEVVYAGAPDYIVWTRLADGGLASLVYNREQQIKGWSRHVLGLTGSPVVESLCVVPDTVGNDRLWIVARRTKSNTTQRLIMMMSDPDDRMRLDGAERYAGVAAGGVSGLDHLNGEAVTLMYGSGDGRFAQASNITVTGGVATLPGGQTATEIIAGQPFTSRFESLPLTANSAQGERLKLVRVDVAFEGVRLSGGTLTGGKSDTFKSRDYNDTSALTPVHTVETLTFEADAELDPRFFLETTNGFDLTIKSYEAKFNR